MHRSIQRCFQEMLYEVDASLAQVVAGIAAQHAERCAGYGLRALCGEMHEFGVYAEPSDAVVRLHTTRERGAVRGMVVNLERSLDHEDAVLDHMRFVRSQHSWIHRVAVLADEAAEIPRTLARIFGGAEVRAFSPAHEPAAIAWCTQSHVQ